MLGDLIAVDVRAIARGTVLEHVRAAGIGGDLGVIAGHFAAGPAQIVGLAPAEREGRLRYRDNALAERVHDFEASLWHPRSVPQRRRRRRTISITTPAVARMAADRSASRG